MRAKNQKFCAESEKLSVTMLHVNLVLGVCGMMFDDVLLFAMIFGGVHKKFDV